ncbi:hypothetical protein [Micromonospora sp. DPT]|uniref:hypothetical protein n=1 Tax=Micromonospora sp. DPT TaxID=3142975 RepID=UPI003207B886
MPQGQAGDRIATTLIEIRMKLTRWALFGVTIALTPIMTSGLTGITRSAEISYDRLVGRGELLLIAAGVAAAGIGELFGREETRLRTSRLVLVGVSILLILLTSYWFADIAAATQAKQPVDQHVVAEISTYLFVITLGVTACSLVVSEIK